LVVRDDEKVCGNGCVVVVAAQESEGLPLSMISVTRYNNNVVVSLRQRSVTVGGRHHPERLARGL
jgi:hypothetical protein